MSDRRTHVLVAGGIGGLSAWVLARNRSGRDELFETLGGVAGGAVGGMLPDLLDPPTSPNHRGLGHGGLALFALVEFNWGTCVDWLRQQAARLEAEAGDPTLSSDARSLRRLGAVLCTAAAGAVPGFVAGYASHLVLDLATPSGLPLIS